MKPTRQRRWQINNPDKANLLRQQTAIRKRYRLLKQGIVKTHEEIYDIIVEHEKRGKKFTGSEWWVVFEYLDFKYNNSAFTDLKFSRWLETIR